MKIKYGYEINGSAIKDKNIFNKIAKYSSFSGLNASIENLIFMQKFPRYVILSIITQYDLLKNILDDILYIILGEKYERWTHYITTEK